MNIFPLQGNVYIYTFESQASFLNPFLLVCILTFVEVVSYEINLIINCNVYLRNEHRFTSKVCFM